MPKKFTDFQLKQTLTDNDFFVGINSDERSEFKTNVSSLSAYVFSNVYISSNWDSVYSSVNSASSTYVRTEETNTIGLSAINKIVAVSALPVTPDPSTLYIVIL